MASWTFDSDAEGWGGAGSWTGADGHGPGCMTGEPSIGSLSIAIDAADPVSFWYRVIIPEDGSAGEVILSLLGSGTGGFQIDEIIEVAAVPYDSGWVKKSGVGGNTGTVTALQFNVTLPGAELGDAYFDTVYVAEAEPDTYGYTHSAGGIPGAVLEAPA